MRLLTLGTLLLLLPIAHDSTAQDSTESNTVECKHSDPKDVECQFNNSCVYGEPNTVGCHVKEALTHDTRESCIGDREFKVIFACLYCWQLPEDSYDCEQNSSCKPHTRYLTRCTVNSTTYCLGNRVFNRFRQCVNKTGHEWSMALILSILFGGFGVDRFYLGHWQEGVGKLFSFGGFGIWTLIDSILIAIGYLKPADSSEYEL